jgi:hypothetical protein
VLVSQLDPEEAITVIGGLTLPRPRNGIGDGAEQPAGGGDIPRTVAIGSQVAEFAPGVDRALRADIVNSFLVAQLAANSFLRAVGGGSAAWYDRFFFVLANSGWNVERPAPVMVEISGGARDVYQQIVPIVTQTLGAQAESSTVVRVLSGLATRAPDRPWITLVERESQRASANQFQFAHIVPGGLQGGDPRVTFSAFELDARQSVTDVLFFRFTRETATLRHSAAVLTLNRPVFERVKPLVEERIRDQVAAFVEAVEL